MAPKIIAILIISLLSANAVAESIESINKSRVIEISDFGCADKSAHMMEWLGRGKNYRQFLVADVEQALYEQQPGSQLLKLECSGEPELLTGALPENGDTSKAIVTRFSATFPLMATVDLSGSIWVLTIEQNYYAENLNLPSERKLTQNFTVKGSVKP